MLSDILQFVPFQVQRRMFLPIVLSEALRINDFHFYFQMLDKCKTCKAPSNDARFPVTDVPFRMPPYASLSQLVDRSKAANK